MLIGFMPASLAWGLTGPLPSWVERFHIGGNAAVRYMSGQPKAQQERNNGFMINQAGLVFDVDVAENISFWYDTNLMREGQDRSTFREQLYLRFDKVFKQNWLNFKVGRTFLPYGEDYLLWNSIENPLASPSAAFLWALDEGVMMFGDVIPDGKLSYVAAVQNGNSTLDFDDNKDKTAAVKLITDPLPWLHASASYLYIGKQGDEDPHNLRTANTEFWLSGFHIVNVGVSSAAEGASGSRVLYGQGSMFDLKFHNKWGHVAGNYGYLEIKDSSGTQFNRYIHHGMAEVLGYVPFMEQKLYLVGRYSTVGTFDANKGYRFAGTEIASSASPPNTSPYSGYNFNMNELFRWSFGMGYFITKNILVKAEYTIEDARLIDRAQTRTNVEALGKRNYGILEVAARF